MRRILREESRDTKTHSVYKDRWVQHNDDGRGGVGGVGGWGRGGNTKGHICYRPKQWKNNLDKSYENGWISCES